METYEVLEKALGLIEREENWSREEWNYSDDSGPHCAVGAVAVASTADIEERQRICIGNNAATRVLEELSGIDRCLETFNDTHTHAEVVGLFKKAIRAEKAKAGIPVDLPEADDEKSQDRSPVEAAV